MWKLPNNAEQCRAMQSIVCIKCVSSSYVEKTAADWLDGCKVSPLLSLERGAVLLGSFFSGESESVSKWKWKCLQPPLLSLERGAVLLRSFFRGKVKVKKVKVKVSPTSSSLSRTRRSPFIFSGGSDCWAHVNGKWWHFWQFLTTSTTTVALNEMSILVMFISGSMHTWGLFQSLCLPVELHAYGLMALSVRWDVSLPHWK